MDNQWDLVWYFIRLSETNKHQKKLGDGIQEVSHCKVEKMFP